MNRWLYYSAGIAVFFGAVRLVQGGVYTTDMGFACVVAAILVGSGAIVGAIDRARPKPISRDNGGKREE